MMNLSRISMSIGILLYILWIPTLDPNTLLTVMIISMIFSGFGLGLFFPTFNVGMMHKRKKEERGQANGVAMIARSSGYAIGVAFMLTIQTIALIYTTDVVTSFQVLYVVLLIIILVVTPFVGFLGTERNSDQSEPKSEL